MFTFFVRSLYSLTIGLDDLLKPSAVDHKSTQPQPAQKRKPEPEAEPTSTQINIPTQVARTLPNRPQLDLSSYVNGDRRDNQMKEICDILQRGDFLASTGLISLNLSFNHFSDAEIQEIIHALQTNPNKDCFQHIQSVDFSSNTFTNSATVERLFSVLQARFTSLRRVKFEDTGILRHIQQDERLGAILSDTICITWFHDSDSNDDDDCCDTTCCSKLTNDANCVTSAPRHTHDKLDNFAFSFVSDDDDDSDDEHNHVERDCDAIPVASSDSCDVFDFVDDSEDESEDEDESQQACHATLRLAYSRGANDSHFTIYNNDDDDDEDMHE